MGLFGNERAKTLLLILSLSLGIMALPPVARAQDFSPLSILNPEGSRLFPSLLVYPRHPGKPDPRWKTFKWKFTDLTLHDAKMRLYFYTEEEWTAQFAIPEIDEQIGYLQSRFNGYVPKKKFSYLLFSSHRAFSQTNIFNISEGVQGVTSTTEPTMALPYWGQASVFHHISTHEMTHQFQVQKLNDLSEGYMETGRVGLPLWFIEGMAEYYSLEGIDPEARIYLRDIAIHSDKKEGYELPGFYDEGGMDFIHTYKIGQAKIDFLETQFGKGGAQRILELSGKKLGRPYESLRDLIASELKQSPQDIENKWKEYFSSNYKSEADRQSQSFDDFENLKEAGDTIDLYDVSPDGRLIAYRSIDILSGVTSITVMDLKDGSRKIEAAHDTQPHLVGLYFMQSPTLVLTNDWVGYLVSTSNGPEMELRRIEREGNHVSLGSPRRSELHRIGLIEANSPAISPDGKRFAFVGVAPDGRESVYVMNVDDLPKSARKVTHEPYSFRDLHWVDGGILLASDRTRTKK